jgi:hypothetical protein
MEHGPDAIERDPNPTSSALADLRSRSSQQALDILPPQIGGGRFREDPTQRPALTAVHPPMISELDIMAIRINSPVCRFDLTLRRRRV